MLATANAAKVRELAALLTGIPYRLRTLADFPGVTLPPEGADSYVENALGQGAGGGGGDRGSSRWPTIPASRWMRSAARPGVLSARYGGEGLSDAERCAKMLEALKGVPPLKRSARYRCVIASPTGPAGREATVEGRSTASCSTSAWAPAGSATIRSSTIRRWTPPSPSSPRTRSTR